MDGCVYSTLYILFFLLPKGGAAKMETGIPLYPQISFGSSPEISMGNGVEQLREEEFGKTKDLGRDIVADSEMSLEDISQCIQSAQEGSAVERWMACMNSLSSHISTDALALPGEEISSAHEEKPEDSPNFQEQSYEEHREEISFAYEEKCADPPNLQEQISPGALQISAADFVRSEVTHEEFGGGEIKSEATKVVADSDDLTGRIETIIEDVTNGCAELPPLEEVEDDVPQTDNATSRYPEIPSEVAPEGLDIEKPKSADITKLLKLLKGNDIFNYLLKNAKFLILSVISILFMSRKLSGTGYKYLKMIVPFLNVAKQKTILKVAEVLGFEEIKASSASLNEEKTGQATVDLPNDHLLGSVGCLLGMAVASVFHEVIAINHQQEQFISADELARLMRLAVNESLSQVLGAGSHQFADDFEASFWSTFNTKELVKEVLFDKQRRSNDAQEKWVSNLQGCMAGSTVNESAKDICLHKRKEDCSKTSGSAELHWPHARGQSQEQADEIAHVLERSCTLCTAWNHTSKVGVQNEISHLRHQFCNQSNLTHSDPQSRFNFTEATISRQQTVIDNCQGAVHKCAVSKGTTFGDMQEKHVSGIKFKVNVPLEYNHTSHLKNSSGDVCGELERNRLAFKNRGVEAAKYSTNFAENFSLVSTERATATLEGVGENNACNVSEERHRSKGISRVQENSQQVILHGHSQCEKQSERQLKQFSGSISEAAALVVLSERKHMPDLQFQQNLLTALTTSFREQQWSNHLKSLELEQKMRSLKLKEEQFHVASKSNDLLGQSLDLSRAKAFFKENIYREEKLNKSYIELSRTCADEFVAGTIFMLLGLAYGARRHSYALLLEATASCQASAKATPKSSWFYNPMDAVAGHFQIALCKAIVVSRMLAGGVFAVIASLILRRIATSFHQAIPTSLVLMVLGGCYGWAGKFFVDNLGGNGYHWMLCWEVLCIFHAFVSCFPSILFYFLNGRSSSSIWSILIPSWMRKFIFHATLAIVLPVMAGLVPFASVGYWTEHFSNILMGYVLQIS